MKQFYVVCEGWDCAGKTRVIRKAMECLEKQDISVAYIKGLMSDNPAGRTSARCPTTTSLLLELFWHDRYEVRKYKDKHEVTIQDRSWYTVLSYQPENWLHALYRKHVVPHLSQPDLLVHFTVSLEERLTRLALKQEERHQRLIRHPEMILAREQRLKIYLDQFQGKKYTIDTTGRNEKECGAELAEQILAHLSAAQE